MREVGCRHNQNKNERAKPSSEYRPPAQIRAFRLPINGNRAEMSKEIDVHSSQTESMQALTFRVRGASMRPSQPYVNRCCGFNVEEAKGHAPPHVEASLGRKDLRGRDNPRRIRQ